MKGTLPFVLQAFQLYSLLVSRLDEVSLQKEDPTADISDMLLPSRADYVGGETIGDGSTER
jgi:hypothetical protein